MSVDRKKTELPQSEADAEACAGSDGEAGSRAHSDTDDGFMPGTAAERIARVWELTREAWSAETEQPLRRDIAVLIRPKR